MDRRFEFVRTATSRVVVGRSIAPQLPAAVAALRPDGIVLVHDEAVAPLAVRLAAELGARGAIPIQGGESCKQLARAGELASELTRLRATRGTVLVALGGGTVTDLAGFTAAIYLRGILCVLCPTTTLAACDAALGGKNGVDHGGLKNRLGTFRQPALLFADVDWLATLPDPPFREGLVEVVKKAAVLDAQHFARLEALAPALARRDPAATLEAVEMAVAMKMGVVVADETEAGPRAALNFGHTIGHALESLSGETLRHGPAVAMGMLAECRAAGGVVPKEAHSRIAALLALLGVDTAIPPHLADAAALWRFATLDKKVREGRLPMVVPAAIGQRTVVELTEHALARALA
ncbi:MAG: 3-dehydroquinate synthase [Planctomycetes bacterium]|nr:3-dehydroquinate synthase [Planctomycetota bacterium]